eukprot:1126369-Pelagomonas_calceolata.AAC.2
MRAVAATAPGAGAQPLLPPPTKGSSACFSLYPYLPAADLNVSGQPKFTLLFPGAARDEQHCYSISSRLQCWHLHCFPSLSLIRIVSSI